MAETVNTSADVLKKEELPKLSASDFRAYNSMAEHMEYFHNRFRASWTLLYGACESGKRPSNISMRQFLSTGLDFCSHLELHHNIEEQHIFPVLAKKMPVFRHNLQMRSQHKEIHVGLVKLQEYLEEVRSGEKELNLKELKVIMDSFGKVLWEHLNDEVEHPLARVPSRQSTKKRRDDPLSDAWHKTGQERSDLVGLGSRGGQPSRDKLRGSRGGYNSHKDNVRQNEASRHGSVSPTRFPTVVLNILDKKIPDLRSSPVMSGLPEEDIDAAISEFHDYIERIVQDRANGTLHALRKSFLDQGPRGVHNQLQYVFYSYVLGSKFTRTDIDNQKSLADLRYPLEWHPQARGKQRTVHVHIGPTNSGKTYHALKRLEQVQRGVYAGPLRLLAHEVYTRMNAAGKACALVTGEEIRLPDGWNDTASDATKMISCTVEMIPLKSELEVAVIDEIQMLANDDRGWAWTTAFTGVRAAEVHLCGEERALPLIKRLAASMGDKVIVHQYQRLTTLKPEPKSLRGKLAKMRKGDCLVTFSVMGIHALRSQIEKLTRRRVAIIYGSLPPETRAAQARLFNDPDNDYDFLVASDAIGMGLNLNIKRVIFETVQKNNGVKIITLSNPEIRQIAGRAGRYKVAPQSPGPTSASAAETSREEAKSASMNEDQSDAIYPAPPHSLDSRPPFDEHTIGLVTTLEQEDYETVVKALTTPAEPLRTAGILPPDDVIYRFCNYFPPGTPFSYMLLRLHEICQSSEGFHLCRLKDQTAIADTIHEIPNLDIQERLILVSAPVSVRNQTQAKLIKTLATCIAEQQGGALLDLPDLKLEVLDREIAGTRPELNDLENLHKGLILYMWLSFRFPGVFTTRPLANHAKELVEIAIEKCLTLLNYTDRAKARKEMRKRAVLTDLEEDLLKTEWLGKEEGEGESGTIEDKSLQGEPNTAADEPEHAEDAILNGTHAGEAGIEEVTATSDVVLDDEGEYPQEFENDQEEDDEKQLDQLISDDSLFIENKGREQPPTSEPADSEKPSSEDVRP
ncbi:hypothetical protein BLS_005413 [Venturia inaequalis]|uniref:RNA helicase n=1 Tax=Venturia inaequalis TaxID=5025 RepID=A0A8H3UEW8_VENIN|nr:hypothetical protein BLS_005413 [Venturia inaequalis]